jgi:retinol dehydrogenase-12
MAYYKSVLEFAKKCESLERLDAVVENAGIAVEEYEECQGTERTIVVNVISTFLLAILLLPTLRKSAKKTGTKPRLTIVSSEVHMWVRKYKSI